MARSRVFLIIIIILIIPSLYFVPPIHKGVSLLLSGNVNELVVWINSWGIFAPILSVFLMILQAIAAPLPSFIITGANGMVFGVFWGVIISWIGATLGALVSYYLAIWFGDKLFSLKKKEWKWLKKIESASNKHGFKVIFLLRLIPVVSFDAISYGAGLIRMKFFPFIMGTALGMLPATIIYTMIGHDFLQLEENKGRLILLFLFIVVLFFIGIWLKRRFKQNYEE